MSPRFFTPPLLLRKSDADLATLVHQGHEAAFSAIVLRHRSHLLRHCRGMLRDHRAEDAVQQTFVRALQALRSGTQVRELRPWLCRIARNVALDEIAAGNWDHAELNNDWEDPAGSTEVERRARLRDALVAVDALPARQRAALLRSMAGEPPAAIAQELGVTSMAARQLLRRARVSVRTAVQALLPPPLLWLSRRMTALSERFPRTAGAGAGAAPVATKVAVVVVASASVAAPVAVIHHALIHHSQPARHRQARVVHAAPDLVAAAPQVAPAPQPVVLRAPVVAPRPVARPPAKPEKPKRPVASSPPPTQPPPSQSPAVSASSPHSAPVGESPGAPSAPSGAAVAADAGASGASGTGSGEMGPISSATASGPTGGAAGGSASGSPSGG